MPNNVMMSSGVHPSVKNDRREANYKYWGGLLAERHSFMTELVIKFCTQRFGSKLNW